MSLFTLPFVKLNKTMVTLVGGKGASLGEMTGAGIPVPPGFVVTAQTFEKFLEETDINVEIDSELDKINYADINIVERESNVIRSLIVNQKMPIDLQEEILKEFKKLKAKYVAVRSSATAEDSKTASWAGELETYLNTTEKTLLENVKKCWASLFTPRAVFYAHEKGIYEQSKGRKAVSVAVVVQKMVESEIAGICFTVHPVTKDKNQLIIEAGWGLGEAIVSGQITPDSYVVDKQDYNILDINISKQEKMIVRKGASGGNEFKSVHKSRQEKQKLTGKQILDLTKICLNIEKHYKFPCDIEWAFEKGKFYIVQSRPITTL